jgi:hypothetical protein
MTNYLDEVWLAVEAFPCIGHRQGCQNFLSPKYQNGEKYTELSQNIPNGHRIFIMAVK